MSFRLPIQQIQVPEDQPLVEQRITGGMNSFIDPADLNLGVGVVSKNTRTYADITKRAPGLEVLAGTDPDTNPVLLYTQYKRFDGTVVLLRFSKSRIDKYSAGVWTQLTGTVSGTNKDRYRIITTADASNDYLIFSNNGIQELQVLNSTASSFAALGNAPKYRYHCVFFNRVVGANLAGSSPNPVQLGWSGDYNFTQWNSLTDISAGSTSLTEAQSDYADPISGLFGFASVMLILRERSLWTATKRPVASNPFAFQAAYPSVGCDTPNSATQTKNGIIWYDYRSNNVYLYEVGQQPRIVGFEIRNDIKSAITDKTLMWGSYDLEKDTYFLAVPSESSSNTRIFAFNVATGSWSYDDRANVYGYYPLDGGISRLSYDELTGTYDQLSGTYNSLGITAETPPVNYVGFSTGKISAEVNSDTGSEEMVWRSKVYKLPTDDQMISRLTITAKPLRSGALTIRYSRNGGTWKDWKTFTFTSVEGRRRLYCNKLIRATEFQWEIRSSTGNFELYEYRMDISASKEDK